MARTRTARAFDKAADSQAETKTCDAPGCEAAGEFRAPKSRDQLNDYYWFCLEHVRAYNKAWNYYADMSETEIESEIRRSTTWDRPTWRFGARDGAAGIGRGPNPQMKDRFGVFDDEEEDAPTRRRASTANTPEAKAAQVLGLDPPFDLAALKKRYKELVKRYHPDANGGDKDAEERLKQINDAYTTLRRFLT